MSASALTPPPVFSRGSSFLSVGDCLRHCEEEETGVVEGCPIPSEIPPAEDNGHVDPECSPLKEQVLTETVDMVELSILETESPADSDAQTEVVLH
ncbi:zinc finger protein 263-like protein, partial [Lates japonicus]